MKKNKSKGNIIENLLTITVVLFLLCLILGSVYFMISYEEVCVDQIPDKTCECNPIPIYNDVHSCNCNNTAYLSNNVVVTENEAFDIRKGYCKEYRLVKYNKR